jgi:large subunit ribosomal protein L25
MDTLIEVTPRATVGKGANRKARAHGKVPAVVYGKTRAPESVELDPAALLDLFKRTQNRNTVVSLKVAAKPPIPCLVREVQRHPVSRAIVHVDFYAVPEEAVEVMVPLRPLGRPKGALMGGRLRIIRRELKVRCRWDMIPEFVDVDVAPLDVGDFVRASQIPMPDGVTIVIDGDFNVCNVFGSRKDEPAAAPATAAPAAPAPAKK